MKRSLILAIVAAIASLGGAIFSAKTQIADARALLVGRNAQIAPVPDALLPAGASVPAQPEAMTQAQRQALARAISHAPLDQEMFNLVYADQVRTEQPTARLRRTARLLSQLGWRHTPTQQNLIMRAILDERFAEVVDRADSLLRRQKMPEFAFSILSAMEALPEVHRNVVGKLLALPSWRRDYLSVITPRSDPKLLTARIATIKTLLRSSSGVTRAEIAQSLISLVEAGRDREAHALWLQHTGPLASDNLIYDPRFQQAFALAGTSDFAIPFEWRLRQEAGYSIDPTTDGIMISWDRRGAPTFMTQNIPLTGGRRMALTIQGTADQGGVATLLTPTITCGSEITSFMTATVQGDSTHYLSSVLPARCNEGVLAINGLVDTGSSQVTIQLKQVELRPAATAGLTSQLPN